MSTKHCWMACDRHLPKPVDFRILSLLFLVCLLLGPVVPLCGAADAAPIKLTTTALVAEAQAAAKSGAVDQYLSKLSVAISAELKGKPPKTVAQFAASDGGSLALMQWRLLSRVVTQARADVACADAIAWLSADRDALAMFLGSGEPAAGKWPEALRVLAKVAPDKLHRQGLPLRLSIATALVFAEPVKCMADDSPIDPVARIDHFLKWDAEGVLFPSFRELSAWELRYVVGSWSSDDDLAWARSHIKAELKRRDRVGDGAHMLPYTLFNKSKVSVQDGRKFYDNKPMTLEIMLQYGGVCGAISRFGTSMSQAFGVPAMPVAQPGHCAFIWQKQPHVWSLNNDVAGWPESNCHGGITIPWGSSAWFVPLMQDAQGDSHSGAKSFIAAENLLTAAEFVPKEDRAAIAAEACKACPQHYGAWIARLSGIKPERGDELFKELAAAFERHPAAFAQLYILSCGPPGQLDIGDPVRAAQGAAAIAWNAEKGADPRLSSYAMMIVLEESAKRSAGKDDWRAAVALIRGNAPGDAKIAEVEAHILARRLLNCADMFHSASEGPWHQAWQQTMKRCVRGIVLSPVARKNGFDDLQSRVAMLVTQERKGDARWLADRILEAATEAKDPETQKKAAELRKSLN